MHAAAPSEESQGVGVNHMACAARLRTLTRCRVHELTFSAPRNALVNSRRRVLSEPQQK